MKKLLFSVLLIFAVSNLFAQRSNVEVIYDYLYVFPAELGVFEAKPSRVIEQLNSNVQYGYNSWRLPSTEELALLKANGYARYDATYMTSDNSHSTGIVLLVTTKEDVERANKRQAEQEFMSSVSKIKNQTGFIDLGLPSGKKWAAQNYNGGQKIKYSQLPYGVPYKSDWQELRRQCTWIWVDSENGFVIKGKNGNAIFLGATNGFLAGDNNYREPQLCRQNVGIYWSKSYEKNNRSGDWYWCLFFEGDSFEEGSTWRNHLLEYYYGTVRCIQ